MDLKPVESSNIHSIGYDPETRTLGVRFKNKPEALYTYSDVPPAVYAALEGAESIGSAFHKLIKLGGYAFTKTEG
jgi:hypothetical protein